MNVRSACACAVLLACGGAAIAADAPPPPFQDSAELSYVFTEGNSKTNTFGFKNVAQWNWKDAAFVLKAGAVRASATTSDPKAYVVPDGYVLDRNETTKTSAEFYYLNGRYDHKIDAKFLVFAGAGWDRNRPSGIDNRYIVEAGAGYIWTDTDAVKFRTDAGLTYTKRELVVDSGLDTNFVGVRLAWDYFHKFGANTVYKNTLVVDTSLKKASDFRADMINSLAVTMSKNLALKVGLEWIYANKPALINVPLYDQAQPGTPQVGVVEIEAKKLDTLFTTSLVINF